jgi:flagellar biosynthesis protein FlhG
MHDQATVLRELMGRQASSAVGLPDTALTATTRALVIASGKGGVGKSHIVLNLSVALAQLGHSVCVLDANENAGHLDVVNGSGYWDLSHVASGVRDVEDVALFGPGGIRILRSAAPLLTAGPTRRTNDHVARRQLFEFLNRFDHVVIDTPSGNHNLTRQLMSAADSVWLVTVPELTAIADTYSLLKSSIQFGKLPECEILINRADSALQARQIVNRIRRTTQSFLTRDVFPVGAIPYDPTVSSSAMHRNPFCQMGKDSSAAKAIEQLARCWSAQSRRIPGAFLRRLSSVFESSDSN